MIYEINEVEIADDQALAFESAFSKAAQLLLKVKGCNSALLFRCAERQGNYQVRVGWDQLEDHADAYPHTDEATQIRALLLPFIRRSRSAHFEEVLVGAS